MENVSQAPVVTVLVDSGQAKKTSDTVINVSKIIYLVFLGIMILALLLNIFIRITIQNKSIIVQSLILIVLIIGLLMIDFSFVKKMIGVIENISLI